MNSLLGCLEGIYVGTRPCQACNDFPFSQSNVFWRYKRMKYWVCDHIWVASVPIIQPKYPYEVLYGTGENDQEFILNKQEAMVNSEDRPKLSFTQMIILALQHATYGLSEADPYGFASAGDICQYIRETFPYYATDKTGVVTNLFYWFPLEGAVNRRVASGFGDKACVFNFRTNSKKILLK